MLNLQLQPNQGVRPRGHPTQDGTLRHRPRSLRRPLRRDTAYSRRVLRDVLLQHPDLRESQERHWR